MERQVISITSFKQGVPLKGIWYKYFDDTFISVICSDSRASHLRTKSLSGNRKHDNKKCQWHCDWQYLHIEENYGLAKGNPKTYEIPVIVDGTKHVIDSLTKNIAIEFQHSMGVSLDEMNERFIAHKKAGYTPYLILDYSDLPVQNAISQYCSSSLPTLRNGGRSSAEVNSFFIELERKWCKSHYYMSDNLFLDFKDTMMRLSRRWIKGYFMLKKEYFIEHLYELEKELAKQVEIDHRSLPLIEEKERKEYEDVEKELAAKREEQRVQRERKEIEQDKRIRSENEKAKLYEANFKFYRKCIKLIDKHMPQFKMGLVLCDSRKKEEDIYYYKTYVYTNVDHCPKMYIHYMTVSKIKQNSEIKEFEFNHSEIKLIKESNLDMKTILYHERGGKFKIKSMKTELVKDYLHSLEHPALFLYHEGRVIKEYYLFNHKLAKSDWEFFRYYFDLGPVQDKNDYQRAMEFFETVERNDRYGIYKDLKKYREVTEDTKNFYNSQHEFTDRLDSGNFSEGYKRMAKDPRVKRRSSFWH